MPSLEIAIDNALVLEIDPIGIQGAKGDPGDVTVPQEAETDESCVTGQPLYLKANGHIGLAVADNPLKAQVCGLCVQPASTGFAASYRFDDVISLSNWSEIAGTMTLNPGSIYFLSLAPGQLSNLPPPSGFVVPVGQALTTQKLRISIDNPLQL